LCREYSAVVGVRLHRHIFRRGFAKRSLAENANNLVRLDQLLGHESLARPPVTLRGLLDS
jgi:site-specific recombinase XerC